MDISIVIPSYNSHDVLEDTLKAVQDQITQQSYEVIVVDCSEKNEVELICQNFDFVTFHKESERFNPGIGRNIGSKLASGALLVFVDSDVILEPNTLQNAWEYYSAGNKIFGGALELNTHHNPTTASYVEHFFFNHESQRGRPICPRSNLSSALMLFDRKTFIDKGQFKDIPRMQDTELTERLVKAGFNLTFNPTVVGLQIQDSPMNKVLNKIKINGKNLYFIRYQKQALIKKAFLFLFLPLLSLFKVGRIIARHLRYQSNKNRLITLLITPHLIFAGFIWMAGLYRSMIFGGEISNKRE